MDPKQKYRETHREEIREKAKRYHEENRDHIVERKRANYDPEKSKRYYELNKQRILEKRKERYRSQNPRREQKIISGEGRDVDPLREVRCDETETVC